MKARCTDVDEIPRLQHVWHTGVALLALAVALLCLLWPEHAFALLPMAPRPLHARCIGAMYLAAATCLFGCARTLDAAAVRIPLNLVSIGAGATAIAASTIGPVPWAFLLLHAAAALSAAALAWRGRELLAAAERPNPALLALAVLVIAVAAALVLAPTRAVLLWPWPMPEPVAPFYAAALFAWGWAIAKVAHERRRSARRIVLIGLCTLGIALVAVSALHLGCFSVAGAIAWFTTLGSALALAAQSLRRRFW